MSTALPKKVVLSTPLPETKGDFHELETSATVVEVDILWGEQSLLHSDVVDENGSFSVGESGEHGPTHFLIAQQALGVPELPVIVQHEGAPHLLVPRDGTATMHVPDRGIAPLRAEQGIAHHAPFGSHLHRLPEGTEAEVRFRGFVFRARSVKGARAIGKAFKLERAPLLYVAGAALFVLLLIAAFAYLAPPSSGLNVGNLDQNTMLAEYLIEVEETKDDPMPNWMVGAMAEATGAEGKASAGDEGKLGKEDAPKVQKRYAVKGPKENPNPRLPKKHAQDQARTAGILGALADLRLTTDGPTSPFAKQSAQGSDPLAAMGALLGDVGDSFGFNGLGINGTGRHGGGNGDGTIGMGNHATLGDSGTCVLPHCSRGGGGRGIGATMTRGTGNRKARVPPAPTGRVTVAGSLSKEAIRRAVHRHLNEVRHCYESELRTRPDLAGRVAVKFIIAPDGAVLSSMVAKSSLQNANAEQCIASAVRRWSFPEPDNGGIVAVTYPFMLASGQR